MILAEASIMVLESLVKVEKDSSIQIIYAIIGYKIDGFGVRLMWQI